MLGGTEPSITENGVRLNHRGSPPEKLHSPIILCSVCVQWICSSTIALPTPTIRPPHPGGYRWLGVGLVGGRGRDAPSSRGEGRCSLAQTPPDNNQQPPHPTSWDGLHPPPPHLTLPPGWWHVREGGGRHGSFQGHGPVLTGKTCPDGEVVPVSQ